MIKTNRKTNRKIINIGGGSSICDLLQNKGKNNETQKKEPLQNKQNYDKFIENIIKLNIVKQESGGDGNCFLYSLYDSIKNLEILIPGIFNQFLKCLGIEVKNINKNNFNIIMRNLLGNKIGEGILFDLAEYNEETNLLTNNNRVEYNLLKYNFKNEHNSMIEENEFYGQLIRTKNDKEYKNLLSEYRGLFPNTKLKFNKEYIHNKQLFYNTIKEYVKKNFNYINANGLDTSILNYLLLKCNKIYNNYNLEIINLSPLNTLEKNKEMIMNNYQKNSISIPIMKLNSEHYNSILFN